jgi:hypothetical protein
MMMSPARYAEAGGLYLGMDKALHNVAAERSETAAALGQPPVQLSARAQEDMGQFYSDLSTWDTFRAALPWQVRTVTSNELYLLLLKMFRVLSTNPRYIIFLLSNRILLQFFYGSFFNRNLQCIVLSFSCLIDSCCRWFECFPMYCIVLSIESYYCKYFEYNQFSMYSIFLLTNRILLLQMLTDEPLAVGIARSMQEMTAQQVRGGVFAQLSEGKIE